MGIIGGGPAGAFCAIWLSRKAHENRTPLDITIYDHRDFARPGPAGCNMCAGVIHDSLVQELQALGISLPEHVIQRRIEGYHLHARGGWVDLPTPPGTHVYATFRGPGPLGIYPRAEQGFDAWLLREAAEAGARHIATLVTEVQAQRAEGGPFHLQCRDGSSYEADLLVGAFGVNSNLLSVFENMGFGYRAPRTTRARQAEIPLEPGFIDQVLRNRVVVLAMGRPGLRFAAITPKRQHVTVTLIGDDPTRETLEEVLGSPEVRRHFPPGWEPPERYCSCTPRLPISQAQHAMDDRLVVVGDAHVARYLKNGIESAFHTARWAAEALLAAPDWHRGRQAYLSICRRVYGVDNRYGRALFRMHDIVSRSGLVTRAHLSVAQAEQRAGARERPMCELLWGLFTGGRPYAAVVRGALAPRLQWRLGRAVLSTAFRALRGAPAEAAREAPGSAARSGPTVIVLGGGPAGTACAMGLLHLGRAAGLSPRVILVEAKRFGEQHNQCAGVLSPPGWGLLREVLGAEPPDQLVQRRLKGYVFHGRGRELVLSDGDAAGAELALRRSEMDDLLLRAAERAGAEVQRVRATDVEIGGDRVTVYTEGSSLTGDVVVGAFALDETLARAFSRSTRYRPPAVLETLACKIHPAGLDFIPDLLGDRIRVFLPRLRRIEFGTLIPKGNHITVVIAGRGLTARDMDAFLAEPAVTKLLPGCSELRGYYKGAFPLGPATGTSGHRYVIIGDAAGLVRPFKGKGINSALAGGLGCAQAILEQGLSAEALGSVARGQSSLTRDLWYGRLVRRLVGLIERFDLVNSLIAVAEDSAALRQALFDCVSGRTTYREVVWRRSNLGWLPEAARRCVARVLRLSG